MIKQMLFENKPELHIEVSDAFILLKDSKGNPLIFNNAYAQSVISGDNWIICRVNGSMLAYHNLNPISRF